MIKHYKIKFSKLKKRTRRHFPRFLFTVGIVYFPNGIDEEKSLLDNKNTALKQEA